MLANIVNLDSCLTNERNGTYGGKAGEKEGITINNEYWIVKYPQSTKGMRGKLTPYTTAPLSEYIGSHVYSILGIDVHETLLGIRNGKLVVACKDFCKNEGSLREMRTIKNTYNAELSKQLEQSFSSTPSESHTVDIEDMMIHLRYNPIIHNIPDINTRFWQQFIVDVLINNNDRNNGNWGVLYQNGKYALAPVFDNGASFSNKLPDYKLELCLSDSVRMNQSLDTSRTAYSLNGSQIYAKDILSLDYEDLYKTAINLIPIIEAKLPEIAQFICDIPNKAHGFDICSNVRKCFYIRSMEMRMEKYLKPTYLKALDCIKEKNKRLKAQNDREL